MTSQANFFPSETYRDKSFNDVRQYINRFGGLTFKLIQPNLNIYDSFLNGIKKCVIEQLKSPIQFLGKKTSLLNIFLAQKHSNYLILKFEITGSKVRELIPKDELIVYFKAIGLSALCTNAFVLNNWKKKARDVDTRTVIDVKQPWDEAEILFIEALKHLAALKNIPILHDEGILDILNKLNLPPISSWDDYMLLLLPGHDICTGYCKTFCLFKDTNIHIVIDPKTLSHDLKHLQIYLDSIGNQWIEALIHQGLNLIGPLDPQNRDYRACSDLIVKSIKGNVCQDPTAYPIYLTTFLAYLQAQKDPIKRLSEIFFRIVKSHCEDVPSALSFALLQFELWLELVPEDKRKIITPQFLNKVWEECFKLNQQTFISNLYTKNNLPADLICSAYFTGASFTLSLPLQKIQNQNLSSELTRNHDRPMIEVVLNAEEPLSLFLEFSPLRWIKIIDLYFNTHVQSEQIVNALITLVEESFVSAYSENPLYPAVERYKIYLENEEELVLELVNKFLLAQNPYLLISAASFAAIFTCLGSLSSETILFQKCLPRLFDDPRFRPIGLTIAKRWLLFFTLPEHVKGVEKHFDQFVETNHLHDWILALAATGIPSFEKYALCSLLEATSEENLTAVENCFKKFIETKNYLHWVAALATTSNDSMISFAIFRLLASPSNNPETCAHILFCCKKGIHIIPEEIARLCMRRDVLAQWKKAGLLELATTTLLFPLAVRLANNDSWLLVQVLNVINPNYLSLSQQANWEILIDNIEGLSERIKREINSFRLTRTLNPDLILSSVKELFSKYQHLAACKTLLKFKYINCTPEQEIEVLSLANQIFSHLLESNSPVEELTLLIVNFIEMEIAQKEVDAILKKYFEQCNPHRTVLHHQVDWIKKILNQDEISKSTASFALKTIEYLLNEELSLYFLDCYELFNIAKIKLLFLKLYKPDLLKAFLIWGSESLKISLIPLTEIAELCLFPAWKSAFFKLNKSEVFVLPLCERLISQTNPIAHQYAMELLFNIQVDALPEKSYERFNSNVISLQRSSQDPRMRILRIQSFLRRIASKLKSESASTTTSPHRDLLAIIQSSYLTEQNKVLEAASELLKCQAGSIEEAALWLKDSNCITFMTPKKYIECLYLWFQWTESLPRNHQCLQEIVKAALDLPSKNLNSNPLSAYLFTFLFRMNYVEIIYPELSQQWKWLQQTLSYLDKKIQLSLQTAALDIAQRLLTQNDLTAVEALSHPLIKTEFNSSEMALSITSFSNFLISSSDEKKLHCALALAEHFPGYFSWDSFLDQLIKLKQSQMLMKAYPLWIKNKNSAFNTQEKKVCAQVLLLLCRQREDLKFFLSDLFFLHDLIQDPDLSPEDRIIILEHTLSVSFSNDLYEYYFKLEPSISALIPVLLNYLKRASKPSDLYVQSIEKLVQFFSSGISLEPYKGMLLKFIQELSAWPAYTDSKVTNLQIRLVYDLQIFFKEEKSIHLKLFLWTLNFEPENDLRKSLFIDQLHNLLTPLSKVPSWLKHETAIKISNTLNNYIPLYGVYEIFRAQSCVLLLLNTKYKKLFLPLILILGKKVISFVKEIDLKNFNEGDFLNNIIFLVKNLDEQNDILIKEAIPVLIHITLRHPAFLDDVWKKFFEDTLATNSHYTTYLWILFQELLNCKNLQIKSIHHYLNLILKILTNKNNAIIDLNKLEEYLYLSICEGSMEESTITCSLYCTLLKKDIFSIEPVLNEELNFLLFPTSYAINLPAPKQKILFLNVFSKMLNRSLYSNYLPSFFNICRKLKNHYPNNLEEELECIQIILEKGMNTGNFNLLTCLYENYTPGTKCSDIQKQHFSALHNKFFASICDRTNISTTIDFTSPHDCLKAILNTGFFEKSWSEYRNLAFTYFKTITLHFSNILEQSFPEAECIIKSELEIARNFILGCPCDLAPKPSSADERRDLYMSCLDHLYTKKFPLNIFKTEITHALQSSEDLATPVNLYIRASRYPDIFSCFPSMTLKYRFTQQATIITQLQFLKGAIIGLTMNTPSDFPKTGRKIYFAFKLIFKMINLTSHKYENYNSLIPHIISYCDTCMNKGEYNLIKKLLSLILKSFPKEIKSVANGHDFYLKLLWMLLEKFPIPAKKIFIQFVSIDFFKGKENSRSVLTVLNLGINSISSKKSENFVSSLTFLIQKLFEEEKYEIIFQLFPLFQIFEKVFFAKEIFKRLSLVDPSKIQKFCIENFINTFSCTLQTDTELDLVLAFLWKFRGLKNISLININSLLNPLLRAIVSAEISRDETQQLYQKINWLLQPQPQSKYILERQKIFLKLLSALATHNLTQEALECLNKLPKPIQIDCLLQAEELLNHLINNKCFLIAAHLNCILDKSNVKFNKRIGEISPDNSLDTLKPLLESLEVTSEKQIIDPLFNIIKMKFQNESEILELFTMCINCKNPTIYALSYKEFHSLVLKNNSHPILMKILDLFLTPCPNKPSNSHWNQIFSLLPAQASIPEQQELWEKALINSLKAALQEKNSQPAMATALTACKTHIHHFSSNKKLYMSFAKNASQILASHYLLIKDLNILTQNIQFLLKLYPQKESILQPIPPATDIYALQLAEKAFPLSHETSIHYWIIYFLSEQNYPSKEEQASVVTFIRNLTYQISISRYPFNAFLPFFFSTLLNKLIYSVEITKNFIPNAKINPEYLLFFHLIS